MRDQGAAWILRDNPSEKRQTLEFNLKAAYVNTNIFFRIPVVVSFLNW